MSKHTDRIIAARIAQVSKTYSTKLPERKREVIVEAVRVEVKAFEVALTAHNLKRAREHHAHVVTTRDMPLEQAMQLRPTNRQWNKGNLQHGHTNTPTYKVWAQLVQACTNPLRYFKPRRFICDDWLTFASFLRDMGPQPEGWALRLIKGENTYGPNTACWRPATEHQPGRGFTDPSTWED